MAQAGDRWIAPPAFGGCSLTIRSKATSGLADGPSCNLAGVAQMAKRDLAMVEATSSNLVIRSTSSVSMHSASARNGVSGAGCARPQAGSRAATHLIHADARARAHPEWKLTALVAQQAEQPPCKRQAARSIRRRGHQIRIPHATPGLVNSAARVPACRAGSRGFDSRTGRQINAGIALVHEVPVTPR